MRSQAMTEPSYEIQLRDRVAAQVHADRAPLQNEQGAVYAYEQAEFFMRVRARRLAEQSPAPLNTPADGCKPEDDPDLTEDERALAVTATVPWEWTSVEARPMVFLALRQGLSEALSDLGDTRRALNEARQSPAPSQDALRVNSFGELVGTLPCGHSAESLRAHTRQEDETFAACCGKCWDIAVGWREPAPSPPAQEEPVAVEPPPAQEEPEWRFFVAGDHLYRVRATGTDEVWSGDRWIPSWDTYSLAQFLRNCWREVTLDDLPAAARAALSAEKQDQASPRDGEAVALLRECRSAFDRLRESKPDDRTLSNLTAWGNAWTQKIDAFLSRLDAHTQQEPTC